MSFYIEWNSNKKTENENRYIKYFLLSDPDSLNVFHKGTEKDITFAISVINSVSIDSYISQIDNLDLKQGIKSGQVPQFSELTDGIYRLPELLEFTPRGMGFGEIGYQLVKSPSPSAGVKYGENHAKLAALLELVEIKKRPSNVISTALGKYLIRFLPEEKNDILRRLLLRDYMVQKMIQGSSHDILKYRDVVSDLSEATAIRRRNNVRILLEFALADTYEKRRIDNIDWQVEY